MPITLTEAYLLLSMADDRSMTAGEKMKMVNEQRVPLTDTEIGWLTRWLRPSG